jgi:hypothetical protein
MNKQTKMLVGVGVVAVAGYFIFQSTQKKSFANLTAPTGLGGLGGGSEPKGTCPCSYPSTEYPVRNDPNVPEGTWKTMCRSYPTGYAKHVWSCYSNGPQTSNTGKKKK